MGKGSAENKRGKWSRGTQAWRKCRVNKKRGKGPQSNGTAENSLTAKEGKETKGKSNISKKFRER